MVSKEASQAHAHETLNRWQKNALSRCRLLLLDCFGMFFCGMMVVFKCFGNCCFLFGADHVPCPDSG